MLNIALSNSRKYTSLKTAQSARDNQINNTPILMAEDGYYLVPATNREAGLLIKAGYEVC
jgi:hypothetical protein